MLSKHAITEARNEAISHIPDWPWNYPQQSTEHLPKTAKRHHDATYGCRTDKCSSVVNKYQRVQPIPDLRFHQPLSRRSLQGRESQTVLRISRQQPVHGVIAKPADTIEKDDGVISAGGVFRVLFLHRILDHSPLVKPRDIFAIHGQKHNRILAADHTDKLKIGDEPLSTRKRSRLPLLRSRILALMSRQLGHAALGCCDPFEIEPSACDRVAGFIEAEDRVVGKYGKVGIGTGAGVEGFADRPCFAIVATEFD